MRIDASVAGLRAGISRSAETAAGRSADRAERQEQLRHALAELEVVAWMLRDIVAGAHRTVAA
jgi:hypothetical protein